MLVKCYHCSQCVESKDYKDHVKYIHGLTAQLIYQCSKLSCNRAFNELHSLRKHYSIHDATVECASSMIDQSVEIVTHSEKSSIQCEERCSNIPKFTPETISIPIASEEDESLTIQSKPPDRDLYTSALDMVSSFYFETSLSRAQIQRIVQTFDGFLNCASMLSLKNLVLSSTEGLVQQQINEKFDEIKSVFSGLDTEHKRFKELTARGYYIQPETITFGYQAERNKFGLLENKKYTGQFIPIRKVLKMFFEIPGVFSKTEEYTMHLKSERKDFISNILQTPYFEGKLPNILITQERTLVLPLFLYEDAFETGNPLGSHATIYKMSGVYISIPCIPPEYSSRLSSIFLLQIYHSDDAKIFSKAKIYARIIKELNHLATNGIQINIGTEPYTIIFKLVMIVGDNLGLNGILGYVESFNANYFCRFCKVTKLESTMLCIESESSIRDIRNYQADVLVNNFRKTGIHENSVFNTVDGFHAAENYCADIMHDILGGVGGYDMALVLKHLIYDEKLFSLDTLNFKLKYFDYPSNINPPPMISVECLKKGYLKMSAAEMLSFIVYAGLIFGDLIPEGNRHWELYKLLRQILMISLQTSVSHDLCDLLSTLVEEHHALFIELFGNCLKPKHHNMIHYPRIMKTVGPLHDLWAMRFEAKHRIFKQFAQINCNRRNVCLTLAKRSQLQLSHQFLTSNALKDSIHFKNAKADMPLPFTVNFSTSIITHDYNQIKYVKINGKHYKKGTAVFLRHEEFPVFATINSLFCKKEPTIEKIEKQHFSIIVKIFETLGQNDHLQAYQVKETELYEFLPIKSILKYNLTSITVSSDGEFHVPIP